MPGPGKKEGEGPNLAAPAPIWARFGQRGAGRDRRQAQRPPLGGAWIAGLNSGAAARGPQQAAPPLLDKHVEHVARPPLDLLKRELLPQLALRPLEVGLGLGGHLAGKSRVRGAGTGLCV
jgi:hypothetical protein